jgi:hypothetical protein
MLAIASAQSQARAERMTFSPFTGRTALQDTKGTEKADLWQGCPTGTIVGGDG